MRNKINIAVATLLVFASTCLTSCNGAKKGYKIANFATDYENSSEKEFKQLSSARQLAQYETVYGTKSSIATSKYVDDQGTTKYHIYNALTGVSIVDGINAPTIMKEIGYGTILSTKESEDKVVYYTSDGQKVGETNVTGTNKTSITVENYSTITDAEGVTTKKHYITFSYDEYIDDTKTTTKSIVVCLVGTEVSNKVDFTFETVTSDFTYSTEYKNLTMPVTSEATLIYSRVYDEDDNFVEPKKNSVETYYYTCKANASSDRWVYDFYKSKDGVVKNKVDNSLEIDVTDDKTSLVFAKFVGDYLYYQTVETVEKHGNYKEVNTTAKTSGDKDYQEYINRKQYTTYRYNIKTGKKSKVKLSYIPTSISTYTAVDGTHNYAVVEGLSLNGGSAIKNTDKVCYLVNDKLKQVKDFTFDKAKLPTSVKKLTDERYLVNNKYIVDEKFEMVASLNGIGYVYPENKVIRVTYSDSYNGSVAALVDFDGKVVSDWTKINSIVDQNITGEKFVVNSNIYKTDGKVNDYIILKSNGDVATESVRTALGVGEDDVLTVNTTLRLITVTTTNEEQLTYTDTTGEQKYKYDEYNTKYYNYDLTKVLELNSTETNPISSSSYIEDNTKLLVVAITKTPSYDETTAMVVENTVYTSYIVE